MIHKLKGLMWTISIEELLRRTPIVKAMEFLKQ